MDAKRYYTALVMFLTCALPVSGDEVRGIIRRIDLEKNEIVVEARMKGARKVPIAIDLGVDPRIRVGKEAGEISDLKVGKRVRVTYEMRHDRAVAVSITMHDLSKALANLTQPETGPTPAKSKEPPPVPAPENNAAPTLKKANDYNVSGTLVRVGYTDREIVLMTSDKEMTLVVPKDAQITKDQKSVKLDDLKEGEQVAVRTEKRDGKTAAVAIAVGEKGNGVAQANSPSARPESRIDRIRNILKWVDELLQLAEQRRAENR